MSRENHQVLVDRLGEEVRAHQVAVDALDEAAATYLGVNRTDLRCLDVLFQLGEAAPSELGARLGLTTGSVTALLDRLEKLGYLSRSPDPADRRKVVVRPTPAAGQAAGDLYGPLAQAGAADVARYTAAELELLIDFLSRSRALQEEHVARIRQMRPAGPRR